MMVYCYVELLCYSVYELWLIFCSGELQQVDIWQIYVFGNFMCVIDGFGNVVYYFIFGNCMEDVIIDVCGVVEVFFVGLLGS